MERTGTHDPDSKSATDHLKRQLESRTTNDVPNSGVNSSTTAGGPGPGNNINEKRQINKLTNHPLLQADRAGKNI